jgi:putative ABC transport system ATP-binding protein
MIRLNNVTKKFGSNEVLKGIDLTVKTGEKLVIIGPSGSGKSTFLNLVGGLEPANGGSIRIGGTELTTLSDHDLVEYRRRQLGFVFQFYNLVPDLTIRENIEVCEYLSSNPLPIDDLMDSLGLTEHRSKFPNQVSGGQQQRCAIGRALVKNPSLLLCDEPTGALDYQTSKDILSLIQEVNERWGNTVLMVTHNDAIRHMAHRVVRLRDGRIWDEQVNETRVRAEELEW